MKRLVLFTFVAAAALLLVACAPKTDRTPDKVNADVSAAAAALNAYFEAHDFQNTAPQELQGEAAKAATTLGTLAKEAAELKAKTGDTGYNPVITLATDGQAKASALATAVGAGPALGDAAKAAALTAAIGDWAKYADAIETSAPGTAEPVPGKAPAGTGLPGKGHHYGWYKNPAWANDPASREGSTAVGTGEKERERKRDGTGGGPDRERKHDKDKGGPGGGKK